MFYVRDEYWEQRVLCSDLDMLLCEVIQRIRDIFGVVETKCIIFQPMSYRI